MLQSCNNGRELLSIKNKGAGYCVGFDIAEGFIDQARQLAKAGDIDCEFVQSDVEVQTSSDSYPFCSYGFTVRAFI